jgi:hypothetical protein
MLELRRSPKGFLLTVRNLREKLRSKAMVVACPRRAYAKR